MKKLVSKLEHEVGLTHDQAREAARCMRRYMIEHDLSPSWADFFRTKLERMTEKSQDLGDGFENFVNKTDDFLDDLTDMAAQKVKELKNKAARFLDND